MPNLLKKIRGLLLDILLPIECLSCHLEGVNLCEKCFRKIKFNDTEDLKRAERNLKIPSLEKIFIAGDYEDISLRSLIKKYKYNFILPLGKILARFLITFWNFQDNFDLSETAKNSRRLPFLVIPIPLTAKRLRWRGFNQAEILAREFSEYFNYDLSLDLKRQGNKPPQAELTESERSENIKSAFIWEEKNQPINHQDRISVLSGRDVLLIDDVVTTGATLNEAARILKEAGAKSVSALVLAKG